MAAYFRQASLQFGGIQMAAGGALSAELQLFEQNRHDWLQSHAGAYVAIQDEVVEGFFGNYAEALKAGLRRFGAQRPFLVKQIWLTEPVYLVS